MYNFQELKDLLKYMPEGDKQATLQEHPELKYDYNEVQDLLKYMPKEDYEHFTNKYSDLKPEAGYGEVLFNTPAGALAQTGQSIGGITRAAEELLGTGTKLGESIADESLLAAGQLANEMNLQPDTWKNTIYSGVTSAAQQVPLIVATGFQPELAPLTLATMGAISGGQRYDEARRENYTPGQALLQGTAYGIAEAAGEYLPIKTMLEKTGLNPTALAAKLIKYIVQEEGSEVGTEVMQWATDKVAKEITANPNANVQDLLPRVWETIKATAVSAPILGGAGTLANAHLQNRELQNSIPPESIPGNEELKQMGDNLNLIENMTPEQETELVKQALAENQPEQTQPIEPEPIQQPEAPETDSQAINNITELNNEAQANTQELKQDADEAINILQNAQKPQQAPRPIIEQTNTPLVTEPPASVSGSNENIQPVTQELPVNNINVHDDIQYKRNVDKNKVTNKLKGRVYNPQLAGAIDVFVNPEDGKTYVWNGHHRLQLAKENGIENVKVINSQFNNPQEAKEAGLLKNLAEENGEPLDYRNFFKQKSIENKQQAIDFLKNKGIDVNKGLAEKGFALSQLSDYLTNEYEKGKLPENLATEIGKQLPNEVDQNALYNHLKGVYFDNDKTITTNKLKDLIEFAKSAPKQTGEMDLFGDTEETNRLDVKSNISEFILKQIKNKKILFKKLSDEDLAEAATKIGGIIDTAKASPEQQREALAEFNFKRRMFAAGDPISNALNQATQEVIDGQSEGKVKANTYMAVKKILEEGNNDVENSSQTVRGINEGQGSIGQNQQSIREEQQSGNTTAESVAHDTEIEQKVYKIEQIKTIQDLINNQRNIADTRLTSVIDNKTAAVNYKGKDYTVTETPAGLKFDEIFQAAPKVKQEGLFADDKTDSEREQEAAQNTDDLFNSTPKENNPILSQDEPQKEYRYQMNARPFGIGAQPKGQIRVEEGGGRYGTIIYDRPLTEKETYDYELKPENAQEIIPTALEINVKDGFNKFVENLDAKNKARVINQLKPKINELQYLANNNKQIEIIYDETGQANYRISNGTQQTKINKTEYNVLKEAGMKAVEPEQPLISKDWETMPIDQLKQYPISELEKVVSDKSLPYSKRVELNIKLQQIKNETQQNIQKNQSSEQTDSIDNNIITDPARVQEIKNSITEGELILKTGQLHGRKLTADELANVKRSVANDKAKIGIKEDNFNPTQVTEVQYKEIMLAKMKKKYPNANAEGIEALIPNWFDQVKMEKKIKPEIIDSLTSEQKQELYAARPDIKKQYKVPSGDAFYDPNIGEHKTPQQKNLSDTFMGLNRVELVQIIEDILNSTPEVYRRLRGNALGRFFVKGENGKIKLDATKLKEADFQKITEVLAHEIGHAIDWKEGEVNNTLKRGNVLGRIAALAKFLKHTLNISIDEQPRFLEAKERRRLKAEAKNEVLADIEDKKNIPPELAVEISLLYQQKVKEYMEENGLVHKDYIANEMAELAQQFLGWTDEQVEAGAKWFYKPSELYANTFGAFLTNPQLLQEYAPTVSEMLYSYLKAKPATLKLYNYFQNKINSGERYKENLNYLRRRMVNADVKQSEEMSKRTEKQGFKDWTMTTFMDRLYPVLKYASIAPGSESSFEILNKAQKLRSVTDIVEAHLKSFAPEIAKIIKDNKIDLTDLGLRAFFTRVVEERSKEGIIDITDEQLAQKLNAELESQYSPEQVAAMDEIFKILRDARQPLIDKLTELGIYGQNLIEKLQDNKNYFTFDIVEHYDKAYGQGNAVSGRIQKQIGTLKATANPFVSTILKDIALTRMAIEMDFTKSALKFLGEKGINIQKAQTVNTERGPKNLSPKASSNLGLVEVLEDGKLKGYYVPKDIAETLNNPSMEISVGLQYLSALNHIPRTLFTSASIGFTVSNAIRDSIGSFLKLPHTLSNFGTFSKLYLREFKNALLKTQSEEKVNNLLSKGIIYGDRPMNFQPDPEITPWENILRKFGLSNMATDFNETNASKYARFLNTLMGTVEYLANPILNLSGRIEKASKIAGYDYLQAIKDKYGISENEIDMMAAELVGTPNAKRKGTFTPYMNNLLLFSNVMLQGYKAHATAYKMNKVEYVTKLATVSAAPILLMALCATGDDKDWWEKVSPYHKQNYNIIPLHWLGGKQYDKNGKALYLTLPKEELSRAIGSTFWQAINPQNGSLRETLTSMFNVWGGEIPKTAPAITAAVDTLSYARGLNPYDSFRQQYVINPRTFGRQDFETDKAFATYILNLFGMNTLYKMDTTAKKNEPPKDTVDSLSGGGWPSVYGLNVAGRFLKASDAGERSAINDLKKDVKSEQARELALVDSALNKMYGDNKNAKITPEETEAMRKHADYRKKQIEKYRNPDKARIKEAPKAIRAEVKKILNN